MTCLRLANKSTQVVIGTCTVQSCIEIIFSFFGKLRLTCLSTCESVWLSQVYVSKLEFPNMRWCKGGGGGGHGGANCLFSVPFNLGSYPHCCWLSPLCFFCICKKSFNVVQFSLFPLRPTTFGIPLPAFSFPASRTLAAPFLLDFLPP